MVQWVNCLQNNIFVNPAPLLLLCEVSGAVHLSIRTIIAQEDTVRIARLSIYACRVSLSMVVLIVGIDGKLYGFRKILRFKNQPCNRLYPKKPAGMHW